MAKSIDELAMEHVIIASDCTDKNELFRSFMIMEEMVRRCGVNNTNAAIDRAKQVAKMVGIVK
jgi:hypothetical protein